MKWYFCLNEGGLPNFAEPMLAAVHSALQNTTLNRTSFTMAPPTS